MDINKLIILDALQPQRLYLQYVVRMLSKLYPTWFAMYFSKKPWESGFLSNSYGLQNYVTSCTTPNISQIWLFMSLETKCIVTCMYIGFKILLKVVVQKEEETMIEIEGMGFNCAWIESKKLGKTKKFADTIMDTILHLTRIYSNGYLKPFLFSDVFCVTISHQVQ